MSYESLVVVRGITLEKRRDFNEQIKEIADIADLKFINLQYTQPKFSKQSRSVKGFQSVEIIASGTDADRAYRLEPSKDKDSQDCEGRRNLWFEPKHPTNILEAKLPDTLFNRRRLASCYYHGAQWKVLDTNIEADVKRIADEMEKQLEEERRKQPTDKEIILSLDDRLKKAEEENIRLGLELKKKKEVDSVVDGIKNAPKHEEKKPEEPKTGIGTNREKELENQVKAEVFKEYDVLITELKERSDKWWMTKEYKQKIHPEIQRRLAERLKNANVNAGAGVDNKN
jgi:hypothetical protein